MGKDKRASAQEHFGPELFSFLRALAKNNDRDWFEANRARYEQQVKGPLLRFIGDFSAPLGRISDRFVADPRPSGGSMFRIYRDTRFSKDKAPYKTVAAAQFRHERGKDVHAPGFYLHLAPGGCFAGGGLWRPDAQALAAVRQAIVDDPPAWRRATRGKAFAACCSLDGDSLSRPPRGFDPEHPLIEDLKRKDFVATAELSEADICAAGFIDRFATICRAISPMMKLLSEALALPF